MRVVFPLADRITVLDRGRAAGRRAAAGDRRQRGRPGSLSRQRAHRAASRSRPRPPCVLRQEPHPPRRLARGREGRARRAARANGAGKTTTMRNLMGLMPPRSGPIEHRREGDHRLAFVPDRRSASVRPRRPAHVPRPHRRGESESPLERTRRDGRSSGSRSTSRGSPSAGQIAADGSPAASRRCSRSAARW